VGDGGRRAPGRIEIMRPCGPEGNLELLLRAPAADAIESRLFRDGETTHVPVLLDLEVAQVLRRYVALADGLHAPLVTCDARLVNAPGVHAAVELFGQP